MFRIEKITLRKENAPTFFVDVKTIDGWKNDYSSKSQEKAFARLRELLTMVSTVPMKTSFVSVVCKNCGAVLEESDSDYCDLYCQSEHC